LKKQKNPIQAKATHGTQKPIQAKATHGTLLFLSFEEEEEGTGVASDVVKVEGEDPATPGPLP